MVQKGITIFYLSAKLPASNFYCQIGYFCVYAVASPLAKKPASVCASGGGKKIYLLIEVILHIVAFDIS